MNHPRLSAAIAELCKGETPERSRNFTDEIRFLEKNEEWVWMPMRDIGNGKYAYGIIQMHGSSFITMFSEEKYIKLDSGMHMISTAINQMIDCVLQDNGPDGIAINPFSAECHCVIFKEYLEPILEGKM